MLGGKFITNFITWPPPDVAGGAARPWIQLPEVQPEVGLQTGGCELPSSSPLPFPSPAPPRPCQPIYPPYTRQDPTKPESRVISNEWT